MSCARGGEIAAVSTYITEVGSQRVLARSMALLGITCSVGFFLAQLSSYLVVAFFGLLDKQITAFFKAAEMF